MSTEAQLQSQIDQLERQLQELGRDRDHWKTEFDRLSSRLFAARQRAQALSNSLADIRTDPAGGYQ